MTEFVSISNDWLTVQVSPYGAALARVFLAGIDHSVVLGLPKASDYAQAPHAIGVVVGPIAGRVSKGRVQIGDKTYQMDTEVGTDALHSGASGVQHRLWEVEDHSADRVTLRCDLADGDCGLPGNRVLRATYSLSGNGLRITLSAVSDQDTPINMASHAYWVLDDSGSLDAHILQIHADRFCETDAGLIPTGNTPAVTGTHMNFTTPKSPVGGPPLDGCFCTGAAPSQPMRPVMQMRSARSGLDLTVHSDQPGLVLYTGAGLPHVPKTDDLPLIAPFSALAIEAQGWPDAPTHTQFPSILRAARTKITQSVGFEFKLP